MRVDDLTGGNYSGMIGAGIHHQIENLLRAYASYVTKYPVGIHLDALDTFNGHDYLTS
ncbi:hypothetical protein I5080_16545 [Salmonella enterica]|nr:hypothetical protein I5080_16545 [Salmonella enterica]